MPRPTAHLRPDGIWELCPRRPWWRELGLGRRAAVLLAALVDGAWLAALGWGVWWLVGRCV